MQFLNHGVCLQGLVPGSLEIDICNKFKLTALTEAQKRSISTVKEGKDVFVSTRTGSGKSLTYECYPLLSPGKSVNVIAPL